MNKILDPPPEEKKKADPPIVDLLLVESDEEEIMQEKKRAKTEKKKGERMIWTTRVYGMNTSFCFVLNDQGRKYEHITDYT